MNLFKPVSSIMSTQLMTLSPSASIADAADIFENYNVHHIPITKGKKLVGMVSKTDYLFFRRGFLDNEADLKVEEIRMNNFEVSYIMTEGLGKIDSKDKIILALELFRINKFHAIPVVDNDELVGMVTTHDIIDRLAIDAEATSEYE